MQKTSDVLSTLDTMITEAAQRGLLMHIAEDETLDGHVIQLNGRRLVNFGSCSYLGLEVDPRLKQGAIDAVMRYGTQFSSSRTYVSAPLYSELEGLLDQLFGGSVMIAPATTLGHMATIPVIVGEDDAILLDQQVHHSIQLAANQARVQGTHVELIRHNRMDLLEERIVELRRKYRRLWYMGDGVYSMFGDLAPIEHLVALQERYEQLHLYFDDAHGMSWAGPHGRGQLLGRVPIRDRMVVATSLNKAFAAGGGAFVFSDPELKRKVQTCGGPMIFSGPMQPPMLGAAIASAKIHLSDEIAERQQRLRERIQLCNRLLAEHGLPLLAASEAPIRFIGMGLPRVAYNMVERLMSEGYYTNSAMFPAVPMKRAGVRFALTLHHSEKDIEGLVSALAHHLPAALADEGSSREEIAKAFDLVSLNAPSVSLSQGSVELTVRVAPQAELTVQRESTIQALDAQEWDRMFGACGSFTWEGLRFLEETFRGRQRPEDNWCFHYYVVRGRQGEPVAATFCSDALWKDDMLSRAEVSQRVEERRSHDPYFLTSHTFAMGSLLTEGSHLYVDRTADWKEAMRVLLRAMGQDQERCGASSLVLRDFASDDPEMDAFMRTEGFAKLPLPSSMVIDVEWASQEEFLARLSKNARRHQRLNVLPWISMFDVEVYRSGERPSRELQSRAYQLYCNVKARGFEINTFDLPEDIFERMLSYPGWELMFLYLKPEHGGEPGVPVGVSAAYVGAEHYSPLVVGLDYRFVESHHVYRSFMHYVLRRAEALGARKVYFGMGASLEKQRFGAQARGQCAYAQACDHYHQEVLMQLDADVPRKA